MNNSDESKKHQKFIENFKKFQRKVKITNFFNNGYMNSDNLFVYCELCEKNVRYKYVKYHLKEAKKHVEFISLY